MVVLAVLTMVPVASATGEPEPGVGIPAAELPWVADLSGLQHGSGEVLQLAVPLSATSKATVLLVEREIFAPGEKKIQHGDEFGNVLWEEPLEVYTYIGTVKGLPGSVAAFTFDSTGFVGSIDVGAMAVNYLPASDSQVVEDWAAVPMRALIDAGVDLGSLLTPPIGGSLGLLGASITDPLRGGSLLGPVASALRDNAGAGADDGPANPANSSFCLSLLALDTAALDPVCALLLQGLDLFQAVPTDEVGKVKPYVDGPFQTAHSNHATRVANAYNRERTMWLNQVNIDLSIQSLFSRSTAYSTSGNCPTHMSAFASARSTVAGVDAYQLFTGIDLTTCNGRANTGTQGSMAASRNSIVEAVDHGDWDYYDPDESDDLGLVSGQEIAHNWGEPAHPQDRDIYSCDCYNIMASGTDHDDRGFWFTGVTQHMIIKATTGNLNDPAAIL